MTKQDREEWLQERLSGIGGSDVAAIFGISPWKSKLELWTEKVNKVAKELDSPVMKWGSLLEPLIKKEYEQMTGRIVAAGDVLGRIVSSRYPFMFANIDGEVIYDPDKKTDQMGHGVLEIKTKNVFTKWEEGWEEGHPPPYYMLQLQHYLAVTGYKWGSFAILDLATMKLVYFDIDRDNNLIEVIIKEEKKFWDSVVNKKKPEVESSKACSDFLKSYYNESEPVTIDLTDNKEAERWVLQVKHAKAKIKEFSSIETEAKNHLMEIVGSAEQAIGNGFKITWKSPKDRKVFDSKRFKEDYPQLYNEYTIEEPQSRRFSIRFSK